MWRSFMHIDHFVDQLMYYCRLDIKPKVLHLSGSTTVSWHVFAKNIVNFYGLDVNKVHPRWTNHKNLAPRPYRTGLSTSLSKSLGIPQYDYIDGIRHGL
jgi:dTDP-4-dehydrorhamnose reductase